MIVEYNRPETIETALKLLARKNPVTVPLGGGTTLSQQHVDPLAVVDLQSLGLNKIEKRGRLLNIGATVTLQQLLLNDQLYPALKHTLQLEATYNTRHNATIAGVLVNADGRSPIATGMLALAAQLILLPGEEEVFLGDLLPFRKQKLIGRLITNIIIPTNVKLAYHYVARTPADLPIVCVGVAKWPSGRTRVTLGGFGPSPILAMDGPESSGAVMAARIAFSEANDSWATGEYRSEVAAILVKRCLDEFVDGTQLLQYSNGDP